MAPSDVSAFLRAAITYPLQFAHGLREVFHKIGCSFTFHSAWCFLPALVGQLVAARLTVLSGGAPSSKILLSSTSVPLSEVSAVPVGVLWHFSPATLVPGAFSVGACHGAEGAR